jgi:hypothetical protein
MTKATSIDAVRNRKTQKLFILVDDSLDMRYKVINPSGEVLILPDLLFDEDPFTVSANQFDAEFTPVQLDAYEKYLERKALDEERERQQEKLAALAPKEPERKKIPPAKKSAPKGPRLPPRRGLGATWSAPRLTFYRHKIDPLDPKQTFKIVVEGLGSFEISKEDFVAQFNDVMMSPSYRAEGLFSYREVPEKAKRYIKS